MNKQYRLGQTIWKFSNIDKNKPVYCWEENFLYEEELIKMGADRIFIKIVSSDQDGFHEETLEKQDEDLELEEIKELEQIKMTASDFHGLAKIFEFWISEAGSRVNKLIYNQNKLTRIVKQLQERGR